MQLLPLTISVPVNFLGEESEQILTFFPDGQRFHWHGGNFDKIGTYQIINEEGLNYLEISYNYAREERLVFTMLDMDHDRVTAFTLKDKQGKILEFRTHQMPTASTNL